MNILLDTHIALWALYDSEKLKYADKQIISDVNNTVYFSLASAWEIEIKHSLGKLDVSSDAFIKDCESIGFVCLQISKGHILALQGLESPDESHKDPFDRLLIAQAESEAMRFLTYDNKIKGYYRSINII